MGELPVLLFLKLFTGVRGIKAHKSATGRKENKKVYFRQSDPINRGFYRSVPYSCLIVQTEGEMELYAPGEAVLPSAFNLLSS